MILQRFTPFVLFLLIALVPLAAASAQELPATPIPAKAPSGILVQFPIAELPTPHAEVWFLRLGLEPGGSLPLEKQIGPVVAYVESGELTLSSDRPVTVSTGVNVSSPAAAVATPTVGEYRTVLGPGASALIDDGSTLTAKNAASEATTFLVVFVYAAERENESSADS
ncbi:MAG: hypothetical protein J0H06_00120, partial [Actinobacteria bacterium]|nr:hypothetical protein [Actinomycetota bacterium]